MKINPATLTDIPQLCILLDELFSQEAEFTPDHEIQERGLSKILNNEDIGVIDKRNLDIWDTVELIATSAIFIGVNSGPLHIANCYPHINKKVIITSKNKFNKKLIKGFRPLKDDVHVDFKWLDYGLQYYNDTEFDIGCTHSYKKI